MTKPIVSIKDYSLTIGKKRIVEDLSFEVLPGEVFAFLGANGSGKTSTIRSLLGIYDTTSGELLVNGKKLTPEDAHIVGYLPEERGLYTRAKVLDTMTYFGELKGMERSDAQREALAYLERVDLADKANVKLKKLHESATLYEQNDRAESAADERKEAEILSAYLPAQLSEDELQDIIDTAIQKLGVSSPADMGKVIGAVKTQAGTSADGATIARLVKQTLS